MSGSPDLEGATPERLLRDLELLGLLFESLVIRDLRIYAQASAGRVLHYRDNTGLEVDSVVETVDGHWAAFEVKLASRHVRRGGGDAREVRRQGRHRPKRPGRSTRCHRANRLRLPAHRSRGRDPHRCPRPLTTGRDRNAAVGQSQSDGSRFDRALEHMLRLPHQKPLSLAESDHEDFALSATDAPPSSHGRLAARDHGRPPARSGVSCQRPTGAGSGRTDELPRRPVARA